MSRLIDADALKKNYTNTFAEKYGVKGAEMFRDIIDQMPTAYDVEKVVAELEEAYPINPYPNSFSNMKEFIENLISRLEELRNDKYVNGVDRFTKREKRVFDIAETIVNQLAEEYRQDLDKDSQCWIPTSERLPEKNAIVLTCDKDGWISVKVNMPYAGVKNDFECGYYTAWMPLPEPFTPKEGRE